MIFFSVNMWLFYTFFLVFSLVCAEQMFHIGLKVIKKIVVVHEFCAINYTGWYKSLTVSVNKNNIFFCINIIVRETFFCK